MSPLLLALAMFVLSIACPAKVRAAERSESGTSQLYLEQCAGCHGKSGRGDGPETAPLHRRLRSFHDCDWMNLMSDATLFLIIKQGSSAAGFPSGMSGFGGKLTYEQMVGLISYIRSFCR